MVAAWAATAQAGGPLLYRGARVVTLDGAVPVAEAVLVDHGRIKTVYARAPAAAPAGAGVVELRGGVLVPGLHDAHVHVGGVGRAALTLDLVGTRSAAEVVQRVAARLEERPGGILVGRGWDQNDWACGKPAVPPCGGTMPTRALLDAVAPDTPVFLERIDGHAAWVNSAALRLAVEGGATALARGGRDPEGGRIHRDGAGEATGILVDNAMTLVEKQFPAVTPGELQQQYRAGALAAARAGLTSVHEMGASLAGLEALRALDRRGELPVRVFVYLDGMEAGVLDALPAGGIRRAEGRVEVRGIKLFADGAMGSRGAVMLAPYSDEKGTRGLFVTEPKVLEARARAANDRGFQVAIHAIGDAGNREVLGLFARLGRDAAARRHRVEHAQVVDPRDWPAFKATGAVASMQPTHATSDMPWAEKRLGRDRLRGAYAWKSLAAAGAPLALGSDAPVEGISPLWGLYAATTRMDQDGTPGGGWTPGERLSAEDALRGFTVGAAWAVAREGELGVVREGALADLTWLSVDPLTAAPAELLRARVLGRMVDGVLERAED
ncbi:MAG: amidohydrolase [Deltaproteobacteria bacterium]|nr:amidohydrolase [Deltaproteobacteria bacterium]